MKKITVLGGGTGTFVVLSGLKKYEVDLAVIVTMMDSGGSTGRLRDQLGVLPPGDVRQCLVALSEASLLWRKLFLYRFEKGDLKGHNFGNIFLSALEKISKNYNEVLEAASYILRCKGEVIPVTFKKTNLLAVYSDGKIIKGEGEVDEHRDTTHFIVKLSLSPKATANPRAIQRIKASDFVILGPGDLYTSIIPTLLPIGVKQALKSSKAKFVYILNLMTKKGQTHHLTAKGHVNELEKYLGREIDYIIVNKGKISKEILEWYKKHGEYEVKDDLGDENNVIRTDLIYKRKVKKSKADVLQRSILRHDSRKLAKLLITLFKNEKA